MSGHDFQEPSAFNKHLTLQVGGESTVRVPPYLCHPSTTPGSTMDAAVPHLTLMTAHPLYQVHSSILIGSDQEHPMLIGHIAWP
jgi:hypothetical protein